MNILYFFEVYYSDSCVTVSFGGGGVRLSASQQNVVFTWPQISQIAFSQSFKRGGQQSSSQSLFPGVLPAFALPSGLLPVAGSSSGTHEQEGQQRNFVVS